MKVSVNTHSQVRIYNRCRQVAFALFLVLCSSGVDLAAQPQPRRAPAPRPSQIRFGETQQFGIRVGGWSHQGESPQSSIDGSNFTLRADYPATNFYLAGVYAYRLSDPFGVEVSFGTIQRGEVIVNNLQTGNRTFGNVTLYPVHVRGFWYPAPNGVGAFRPYLSAGGGIIIGSDAVQIANQFGYYEPQTEITVGWIAGGGIEFALATSFVLELAAAYQPIRFSDPLVYETNFDALAITIGGKYLLGARRPRK